MDFKYSKTAFFSSPGKVSEEMVKQEIPEIETETLMLLSVAGVHTGVQTIGLSWICE
ncbi:hypothetical protein [Peribacillus sp. NPDC096540]|uniref:hypothetical protein n=1 Tax=Peribacillus sp. NPDC096540 TaxID=3390612 RepID=UPI003D05BB1F